MIEVQHCHALGRKRPRNPRHAFVVLGAREAVGKKRVGDGLVVDRQIEQRRKLVARSVFEGDLPGVHEASDTVPVPDGS